MENAGFLDDLLVQILVRLPVKSLLRFRCVSKSWDILISSQYFAKMHFDQSLIHPKPLGLIWKERRFLEKVHSYTMDVFAADFSKLENFADTIQRLHHPLDISDWMDSTIIGSCNGVLCSTWLFCRDFSNRNIYDESFLVFNPLTRKCQWIFSGNTCMCSSGRSTFYGFGYDDAHDDYKVVTWEVFPDPNKFEDNVEGSKFEVYSTTNASWSTRVSGLKNSHMECISPGVLVNCVLHWIWGAWRNTNGAYRYEIVAFDLRTEEHRLMETPENHLAIPGIDEYDDNCCRMDLGVLNGCLCGIVFDRELPNKLDLWVMKEYGAKDSWIKMSIDMSSKVQFAEILNTKLGRVTPIVPIMHVENKKQMMLYSYEEGFLLCDMVTNKLSKVIKIPEFASEGSSKFSFVPKEFCFQGSLVQLPGFDSFDSFNKKKRRMQDEAKTRSM